MNERGRYKLSFKQADSQDRGKAPSPQRRADDLPQTFETKLAKFMKQSEERQLDFKRNLEAKRHKNKKPRP